MVTALPRNIQLRLEQTLAQWRQWRCDPPLPAAPVPRRVLTGGVSNFNVLVEAGQQFVVRIDGINPLAHGLNRQLEWRALQAADQAALAPRPRYFNPELGSLVCDFLPPDRQQALDIPDLASLLRAIHLLPARHHRLDLAERILRYEKKLEHRGKHNAAELGRHRPQLSGLLTIISKQQRATVLCHNDLLQANRIYSGGKLWAIDWEYCAMGNPLYDIAVAVTGDGFTQDQMHALLEAYLQRPPVAAQFRQLLQHSCVYRYLELLWYLTLDHRSLDEALLHDRQVQLDQALQQLDNC